MVGGLQVSSENRKSANLRTLIFFRFADLPQMLQFADLRPNIFAICGPNYFGGLKTSANTVHTFSPHKYKLKIVSFKFKDDLAFGAVLRKSYMAFRSLQIFYA
jgi:hypothetical protein